MRNCSDYWFLWEFVVFYFAFALVQCIIIFSHYFRQRIIIYNRHITNLVILKMLMFSINQLNAWFIYSLPLVNTWVHSHFFGGVRVIHRLSFLCCVFWLSLRFSSNVYLLPTVCPVSCVLSIGKPRVSPLLSLNTSVLIRYLICVYESHFFAGRPYHFHQTLRTANKF